MSSPSNVMAESPWRPEAAPTVISPARRLWWLLRRELWESRSIYLAPLAAVAVCLIGFLVVLIRLPEKMRAALALGPMPRWCGTASWATRPPRRPQAG